MGLTAVKFSIETENGKKYGAFAFDREDSETVNVEKVFKELQNQQPEGVKINYQILEKTSEEECQKIGINRLNSKEKIENLVQTSLSSLKNLGG